VGDVNIRVRRDPLVAVLLVVASVMAACGGESSVSGQGDQRAATVETRDASTADWAKGGWEEIPAPPEGVTGRSPGVWTGEELVVWGSPSAAFRPADRTWRSLPPAPIGDRQRMAGVWSGTEVLYWGGDSLSSNEFFADGAAYDPGTDAWRVIAPSPLEARGGPVADMVGEVMLVWGGVTQCCPIDSVIHDTSAAAYDPVTDSWFGLGDVPAPWSGDGGGEVTMMVGDSLYVFRGQRLGRYDPVGDEWRELPPLPSFPDPRCDMTGGPAGIAEASGTTIFTWSGGCEPELGAAFDVAAGEWRRTAQAPPSGSAWRSPTSSNDDVVFLITSTTGGPEEAAVHAYVTGDDHWVGLPPMPAGTVGSGVQLVWTGSELLAWGGWQESGPALSGAVYTSAGKQGSSPSGASTSTLLAPTSGEITTARAHVAAGEVVELRYPNDLERGVVFTLSPQRPGMRNDPLFMLYSDAGSEGGTPSWRAVGEALDATDVGVGGPGPDRLLLPPKLEPGDYRVCTANAAYNCVNLSVTGPG